MEKLVAWPFDFTILKDNRYRSALAHSQDTITVINYVSISKELVNCMFILNNETFTAMFKRKRSHLFFYYDNDFSRSRQEM